RPWFEKNKARYETHVRDAMLDLVAELQPVLKKVSKSVEVGPRSVMRIYRDVRFSKDKSPYKTYLAAMFWNSEGKESPAPGYYLHVEPGGKTMLAGGVWRPEGAALKKIRDAIIEDEKGWKKASRAAGFEKMGESLKRPPPGFDPEHPLIEDLKRKDFCLTRGFKDAEVVSKKFADAVGKAAAGMAPFMAFLAGAVGAEF
ncbi:MAG TPA: DUF2461 domain-containing protein, partial [Myxococcales bacterium]|nr:DUF2461 domain-containing protein [Myxococcales bacterium]